MSTLYHQVKISRIFLLCFISPGDRQQSVKFQLGVPKSFGDLNEVLADNLAKISKTITFLNRLADENDQTISLSEIISNAVTLYVKSGKSIDAVEQLGLRIEMKKEFLFPEVDVKPSQNEKVLETIVKIPGEDETINLNIDVPKIDNSVDNLALMVAISQKLKKATTTKAFLDNKLANGNSKQLGISEVIANAVALHARQGKTSDAIQELDLTIEIMEDFKQPEVDVKLGKSEKILEATLRYPGEEQIVNFKVGIEKNGNSINIEALTEAISKKIEKVSSATSLLDNITIEDIKEISIPNLITKAVALHAKQDKSIDTIEKLDLSLHASNETCILFYVQLGVVLVVKLIKFNNLTLSS